MPRYRDLKLLHTYTLRGELPIQVLAVGWLGVFTFRRGPTPARFRELLDELCERIPVSSRTRGFHRCRMGGCLLRWWLGNRDRYTGSAEIIVPGQPGVAYRAPTLITHYVAEHRYQPPQVFVDAIMALDSPSGVRWDFIDEAIGEWWWDEIPEASGED